MLDVKGTDDKLGYTPLEHAVRKERYVVVRLLVGHKDIDVSARMRNEETALHMLCHTGDSQIVLLLLQQDSIYFNALDFGLEQSVVRCCR